VYRRPESVLVLVYTAQLHEETGIQANPVDHRISSRFEISDVWRPRYHPNHTHNVEYVFSVQVRSGQAIQLSPQEHSEYVWLPMREAIEKASSPTNRQAIVEVLTPLAKMVHNIRSSE